MLAIVFKELRENLRWLPIGIIVMLIFAYLSLPELNGRGNMAARLAQYFGFGSALVVIGLAAMQGGFDLSDRQRGYLFHRGVSRDAVLLGKVIGGSICVFICTGIPLVIVALWFTIEGPNSLPVRPMQTVPAAIMCAAVLILHPAILIVFDRRAHWFGTRLFPLAAAIAALSWFSICLTTGNISRTGLALCLVTYALLFAFVMVALVRPTARNIVLVCGALIVALTLSAFLVARLERLDQSALGYRAPGYGLDRDGTAWMYRAKRVHSENGYEYKTVPVSGDRLAGGKTVNLDARLPEDFDPLPFTHLQKIPLFDDALPETSYSASLFGKYLYYDNRGIYLVYDVQEQSPYVGFISKSGFHRPGEASGPPFRGDAALYGGHLSSPISAPANQGLWCDRDGIYQFDWSAGTLRTLVEMPIESVTGLTIETDGPPHVLLQSEGRLHQFALRSNTGEQEWFNPPESGADISTSVMGPLPELRLERIVHFPRTPDSLGTFPAIAITVDGKCTALGGLQGALGQLATLESGDNKDWKVVEVVMPEPRGPGPLTNVALATFPSVLLVVAAVGTAVTNLSSGIPLRSAVSELAVLSHPLVVVFGLGFTALWIAMVWLLCQKRGLSHRATLLWSLATLLLGLAGPLSVIALFPRLHREACPRCERLRRVDRMKCEHCGANWETPAPEGIELLDANQPNEPAQTV